jgi:hypothetical protein
MAMLDGVSQNSLWIETVGSDGLSFARVDLQQLLTVNCAEDTCPPSANFWQIAAAQQSNCRRWASSIRACFRQGQSLTG